MDTDCIVCLNKMNMDDKHVLGCSHELCRGCYQKWRTSCRREGIDVTCPCCRHVVEKNVDVEKEMDMMIVMGYQEYERVVYGEESSTVGLELVDVGGSPTWRELLRREDSEIYEPNDELVGYDDGSSDSDTESYIDYPDEEEQDYDW